MDSRLINKHLMIRVKLHYSNINMGIPSKINIQYLADGEGYTFSFL